MFTVWYYVYFFAYFTVNERSVLCNGAIYNTNLKSNKAILGLMGPTLVISIDDVVKYINTFVICGYQFIKLNLLDKFKIINHFQLLIKYIRCF